MKTVSRASLLAFGIGLAITLANVWHIIPGWFSPKPGFIYTGIAHFYADYFLYINFIAQGTRGAWIFTQHLFTNEALAPTWIYWFYTLLGHLGTNPFLLYTLSLIILSSVLIYVWWLVLDKKIIAFLFVLTASNISGLGDFWFSPTPALNRLGGVPHQILQTILILCIFILFKKKKYIALSLVSFIAATANPIQMLLVSVALTITNPRIILYLIPAGIGALITNYSFIHDPILIAAKFWENSQMDTTNLFTFLLGVGPIIVLVPFGIQKISIRNEFFIYGVLSILLFLSPIPSLLHTAPARWLSPASYAIIPMIASYGLTRYRIGIVALFLVLTIPSFISQIQARQHNPDSLTYIPVEEVQKLKNISGDGVVLTSPAFPYDVVVPVFTGKKSFTGHPIHTLYPQVKEELRRKYFFGEMNKEEKEQFLKDHNITYVQQ